MYKAEIIEDSLSPKGDRLTTFVVVFPRIVLAEFNTHRAFSRNSASSRAIPFKKMVKMVQENPFIPMAWQENHKGMQGFNYLTDQLEIDLAISNWLEARDSALDSAINLNNQSNVTKQLCNRLLEPFMWHKVIITSSKEGLENFFKLRCPSYFGKYKSWKDACVVNGSLDFDASILERLKNNKSQADIHIQAIAELMWDAYNESTPKSLEEGDWHLPFSNNIDWDKLYPEPQPDLDNVTAFQTAHDKAIKISVARCARISYQTLGDNPVIDYEKDIDLFYKLKNSEHWSPFEHIAKATDTSDWDRNFKGFKQLRSILD